MKIHNGKDFWAGIMFIGAGVFFMAVSQNYPMGTAVRMGPAYFPTWLGGLMTALGVITFLRAFVSKLANPLRVMEFRGWFLVGSLVLCIPLYYWTIMFPGKSSMDLGRQAVAAVAIVLFFAAWGPRSLAVVLIAIAAFGYLLRPAGLAIATVVLVMGSALGGHEYKTKESLILAVFLAIFVVLVFIYGLGLSMNVWPDY